MRIVLTVSAPVQKASQPTLILKSWKALSEYMYGPTGLRATLGISSARKAHSLVKRTVRTVCPGREYHVRIITGIDMGTWEATFGIPSRCR